MAHTEPVRGTMPASEGSTQCPSDLLTPCDVTVVVPTRNERDNVAPLLDRLQVSLSGRRAQVLFVDDSDDDTPAVAEQEAAARSLPVATHHRPANARAGGLGSAVMIGLQAARSPWVVVMDADLQHPPELVPKLLDLGDEGADIVVASRRIPGGSSDGLANLSRSVVSDLSTRVTRMLFRRSLRGVSDPMSGFFALRPAAFDLEGLHPHGFKILLELLVRNRRVHKAEVPFVFGQRYAGESKASLKEGLRFAALLCGLMFAVALSVPRSGMLRRGAGFAAVGVSGILVNLAAMWLLHDPATLHLDVALAAVIATQLSSTYNFVLIDAVVYRGPKRLTRTRRWLGFMAMSNLVLVIRVPALAFFVGVLHWHYLVATFITLLFGYALRFHTQERLTIPERAS